MRKIKIGILTFHRSINYGAYLQAYALCAYTQNIVGSRAKVEIINYESLIAKKKYQNSIQSMEQLRQYLKFRKSWRHLNCSKGYLATDQIDEVARFIRNGKYDLVIAGSDEIWRVNGMRGFPNAYWLNFELGDCVKISYAASARNEYNNLNKDVREYIKNALEDYEYIGVRDFSTNRMMEKCLNDKNKIYLNCDPVFLYDFPVKKSYKKFFYRKYNLDMRKKIFLVMIAEERLIQLIRRVYEGQFYIVSVYGENEYAHLSLLNLGPMEWINVISIADFFVTNRFHGSSFAIKLDVPFLALDRRDNVRNSKIYDLLEVAELLDRYYAYQGYVTDKKRLAVIEKIGAMINMEVDYRASRKILADLADSYSEYIKVFLGNRC